jgi:hypothetical protein
MKVFSWQTEDFKGFITFCPTNLCNGILVFWSAVSGANRRNNRMGDNPRLNTGDKMKSRTNDNIIVMRRNEKPTLTIPFPTLKNMVGTTGNKDPITGTTGKKYFTHGNDLFRG